MTLIRHNMWRTLSALAFGLMTINPARADVFFSNLGRIDNGAVGFNDLTDTFASDFLTGGTPTTITNLTALMSNSSDLSTVTLTFSIFTDNGNGKPGTLVSVFDTPALLPPSGSGEFTATSPGINLQADTLYWVVGQQNAPKGLGTLYWRYYLTQGTDAGSSFSTVPSTDFQYSPNDGANYVNSNPGNLMFSLEGITPAPEPGTLALLALGAATIAGCGWHRRRTSRE